MSRIIQGSHIAYGVAVEENVRVPMRDGLTLAADLYLPADPAGVPVPGRFPTIVYRTPYDRKRAFYYQSARYFAARGYAWLCVDCRGRFGSDGEFHLYNPHHEGLDGYDTISWATGQPWCDGKVGTTGQSFEGASQQATAVMKPPGLMAQLITDSGINYWERSLRNSGAFAEGIYAPYAVRMAMQGKEAAADPAIRRALEAFLADIGNWIRRMPLRPGATPLALAPSYERWYFQMAHQGDFGEVYDNPMTTLEDYIEDYPDIPVFLMASWYGNRHAWGNFKKFEHFRRSNRSPVKLIVGHYLHVENFMEQSHAGKVDFGLDSIRSLNDYRLRWFDQFLKGYDTGILDEPPLLIRTLGGGSGRRNDDGQLVHGGAWRGLDAWPPSDVRIRYLYLRSDGRLSEHAPDQPDAPLEYLFNPADPVPTIGGGMQNPRHIDFLIHGGGFDQRGQPGFMLSRPGERLSARSDVLAFRTAALAEAVEVTGDVYVELWVRSSAVDTDFTAKLVDEYPASVDYPEGFELNLVDEIVRMSYRDGRRKRELIEPGKLYKVTIGPMPISNRFEVGHRIRIDISSSSFPQFDVNPNTGAPFDRARGAIVARNAIFVDAEHPSVLKLPVSRPRKSNA